MPKPLYTADDVNSDPNYPDFDWVIESRLYRKRLRITSDNRLYCKTVTLYGHRLDKESIRYNGCTAVPGIITINNIVYSGLIFLSNSSGTSTFIANNRLETELTMLSEFKSVIHCTAIRQGSFVRYGRTRPFPTPETAVAAYENQVGFEDRFRFSIDEYTEMFHEANH
jgi:hypothetical protein